MRLILSILLISLLGCNMQREEAKPEAKAEKVACDYISMMENCHRKAEKRSYGTVESNDTTYSCLDEECNRKKILLYTCAKAGDC